MKMESLLPPTILTLILVEGPVITSSSSPLAPEFKCNLSILKLKAVSIANTIIWKLEMVIAKIQLWLENIAEIQMWLLNQFILHWIIYGWGLKLMVRFRIEVFRSITPLQMPIVEVFFGTKVVEWSRYVRIKLHTKLRGKLIFKKWQILYQSVTCTMIFIISMMK